MSVLRQRPDRGVFQVSQKDIEADANQLKFVEKMYEAHRIYFEDIN